MFLGHVRAYKGVDLLCEAQAQVKRIPSCQPIKAILNQTADLNSQFCFVQQATTISIVALEDFSDRSDRFPLFKPLLSARVLPNHNSSEVNILNRREHEGMGTVLGLAGLSYSMRVRQ